MSNYIAEQFAQEQVLVSECPINLDKYKTELCRNYTKFGCCKYGDYCMYAHGPHQLMPKSVPHNYRTKMCKHYTSGYCPYGNRCQFLHEIPSTYSIALRANIEECAHSNSLYSSRGKSAKLGVFRRLEMRNSI